MQQNLTCLLPQPFFMQEVQSSEWYATIQKPTRIVGWAREAVPEDVRNRIPAPLATADIVAKDEKYAGIAVVFLVLVMTWVVHATFGLVPMFIVCLVTTCYYMVPALMKKKGMRMKTPAQLEAALVQIDEVICSKMPEKLRCSLSTNPNMPLVVLSSCSVLVWHMRWTLPHLIVPVLLMALGGGAVYGTVVLPLNKQLRILVNEHNEAQTHHANESRDNEELRMREAQLAEEVRSLQALCDEYKNQYERALDENKKLRSGVADELS